VATAGATATHCACARARGQNRSTAIVLMMPHENAIMQRPATMILPHPGAGTTTFDAIGVKYRRCAPLDGVGVLNTGGGVSIGGGVCIRMIGAGVCICMTGGGVGVSRWPRFNTGGGVGVSRWTRPPAGGVMLPPTFILKLLLPR